MGGVVGLLFLMLFVPSVVVLWLSYRAKNSFARWVLRYGSLYFLAMFLVFLFMGGDCRFMNGLFEHCRIVPDGFARLFGTIHVFNVHFYSSVAPVLVLIAGIAEASSRERIRDEAGKARED